jgi:hypothetical protein
MKEIDWMGVSLVSLIVIVIVSVTTYCINDRNLMSKNIEQAITKGIDPLSVKCAYETQPGAICITYALKK